MVVGWQEKYFVHEHNLNEMINDAIEDYIFDLSNYLNISD